MKFDDNVTLVATQNQVSCELSGEAAILNTEKSVYYGLDPVGARVWKLLQEPRSVGDVLQSLLNEYDVEPARCREDLDQLLTNLHSEGLIEAR